MTIKSIHKNVVNFYKKVEQVTKDKPIAAIIYSIAMKIFAMISTIFPNILGFSVFMLSLTFDVALIANLKEVNSKIKDKFFRIIDHEEFDGFAPEYIKLQRFAGDD